MIHRVLADISLSAIFVVVAILIFVAAEVGAWIGRRVRSKGGEDADASVLATASLGLLALLIAFTYSLSLERYDLRRTAVLQEANAIGSAANYALMLPEAQRKPVLDLLHRYTRLRIGLGVPFDPAKFASENAETVALQGQMWALAVAASAAAPQSLPVYMFVSNLNEVNNAGERRLTALRNHVPVIVMLALVATALVAMGFTGYASGLEGSKRILGMTLISLMLSMLIMLTVDLDRPDRGTIQVPVTALQDTLAGLPPAR